MIDVDIKLPPDMDLAQVETAVEASFDEASLRLTMKGTLKMFPDSIHWHFKQGSAAGVLEATWWIGDAKAKPARLWLSAHRNRTADWMPDLIPVLQQGIEARLSSPS